MHVTHAQQRFWATIWSQDGVVDLAATRKDKRRNVGLDQPVITSTLGRCVLHKMNAGGTRLRQPGNQFLDFSLPTTIIRSASSSITTM
jgi:hypothetical protein